MLKSYLYQGQTISMGQLHAGALLGSDFQKTKVMVKPLQNLYHAKHRCVTKSLRQGNIQLNPDGVVNVMDCTSFILNAPGASAADGFCGLQLTDPAVKVLELHQNKHIKKKITPELFKEEYDKAALEEDFFIIFSTSATNIMPADFPSQRAALVCKGNFTDYFGPFAGRAFYQGKICINDATRLQLQAAHGIGPVKADKILAERISSGPFKSRDDFQTRCKLKEPYSHVFTFPKEEFEKEGQQGSLKRSLPDEV